MRKLFLVSAGLLALAACGGGGDRAAIVNSCVENSDMNQADCECMADAAKDNLDPALYKKFASAVRSGEDATDKMMEDLPPEDQGKFVGFIMQAAMTCNMES